MDSVAIVRDEYIGTAGCVSRFGKWRGNERRAVEAIKMEIRGRL